MSFVLCAAFLAVFVNVMTANRESELSTLTISRANSLLRRIVDTETGLRGFLLTRRDVYLNPYRDAQQPIETYHRALLETTTSAEQRAHIERAIDGYREWHKAAEAAIKLHRSGARAIDIDDALARKAQMDVIRRHFEEYIEEETRVRDIRDRRVRESSSQALILIVVASAFFGGLIAVGGRRQLVSLSKTYEEALEKQQLQFAELEASSWARIGQAKLSEALRGDPPIEDLGSKTLAFLRSYLGARAGAFYHLGPNGPLERVASLALPETAPKAISRGIGLVGQAVTDLKPVHLKELPSDYFRIVSATGETLPKELVIAPLTADGIPQGVLELAFLEAVPPHTIELIEDVAELVGVALRSAVYRTQLQDLLHESQQLTEELQTQQEELKVSNEELSERTRVLQETQARMESQHSELEQTNEQLEEQAQALEAQRRSLDERNQDLELIRRDVEEKARQLETANRYKSEFLANMSHELRTPLNSSLILAKLLKDNPEGNLTAEQVDFASTIYSSGNDLLGLINDILDLSKVEAGKLEIQKEKFSLASLLDGLRKTFEPLAREKGLEFSIESEAAAPKQLNTDRQRLEQILRNLLSNAVKFTSRGSVNLTVGGNDGHVEFAVRDTGIGIESSQYGAIFEAFRQADGTTSRKYGGTGLGLSISRNLAELLGGTIEVSSEKGQGSTFVLHLPVDAPRAGASGQAPQKPAPSQFESRPHQPVPAPAKPPETPFIEDDRAKLTASGGKTLLIVEDDPVFAKTILDVARELGFRCLATDTASTAMELALKYVPQAITLDMKLRDSLGLSVLDQLKANPKTRHIPVQALSIADYSHEALHLGAAGYAIKPRDREELKKVIGRLAEKADRRTKRLLIVEDDAIQRSSMEKLIGRKDVEIVSVGSAHEGLENLEARPFDCAIVDLSLPDMSGFDLLEKIAENRQMAFPPIIVYTGRSLTRAEEERLSKYSRSIIIKGARSPERLLDEVTLFLHQSESQLSDEQQKLLSASRNREKAFEGRNILIADDDPRNIFALTSALEMKGAKVLIARNGREAVDRVNGAEPIDLVLMDIMMPEMDGYEAIGHIRKNPDQEDLPIIAVTAKAMRDDYEKCLQAGANDYLAKPVDVDRLVSLMRVWLPKTFGRV